MLDTPSILMLTLLVLGSSFGFLFNGGILVVNFYKRNFKLDYCWFVYGLTAFNLLYNINVLIFHSYSIVQQVVVFPSTVYDAFYKMQIIPGS